jgi:hypothetical protein
MFELAGTGGYGAVKADALEAAKPVTRGRLLSEEERSKSRRDGIPAKEWSALEREAMPRES